MNMGKWKQLYLDATALYGFLCQSCIVSNNIQNLDFHLNAMSKIKYLEMLTLNAAANIVTWYIERFEVK